MDADMEREIRNRLEQIETERNVRILFAAESGSRAWGLESPDSDYDVRFVYVRPLKEYLRVDEPRDVIEWQLDEVYDINGWDLSDHLPGIAGMGRSAGSRLQVFFRKGGSLSLLRPCQKHFSDLSHRRPCQLQEVLLRSSSAPGRQIYRKLSRGPSDAVSGSYETGSAGGA